MKESLHISVEVVSIGDITPLIKQFTLARVDGQKLPAFSGGSHVVVTMQGDRKVYRNPYSLMGSPDDLDSYQISVRRQETSRGGSAFMHEQVKVGSQLQVSCPVNLFPLAKLARKHLLIAGGIGITPFLAYLEELRTSHVPYELHYAFRSPEHGAFRERLQMQASSRVVFYDRSRGHRIDPLHLLSDQPLGTHVYVCGPAGMVDAVIEAADKLGWPGSHVHSEQFSAAPAGEPFTAYLADSGVEIQVAPDQSLLEAIEAAGVAVPHLCRSGVCGQCETEVLEIDGELIHHDHFLSGAAKASGKKIMPCVSRACGNRAVLKL